MHRPTFQAHLVLESLSLFGLTLYWNQNPRSGSSCVGQFWDLYRQGVAEYNLGTRSGPVYSFKRKFRPEERAVPPPVSVICSPAKFRLWTALVNIHLSLQKLRGFNKADKILRKLLMRRAQTYSRGNTMPQANSGNLANISNSPHRT
jgi:hypothetical protein